VVQHEEVMDLCGAAFVGDLVLVFPLVGVLVVLVLSLAWTVAVP
jgi:hypothetical protein